MKKLIAGNWKMNGDSASNAELLAGIVAGLPGLDACDVLVCPPSVYVASAVTALAGQPLPLAGKTSRFRLKVLIPAR